MKLQAKKTVSNIILFDDDIRNCLLPLTFTRPVGEIRVGILSIREKWEKWMNAKVSHITQDHLAEKYPVHIEEQNFVISGAVMPSDKLCRLIQQLDNNEALLYQGDLIAVKLDAKQFEHLIRNEEIEELEGYEMDNTPFLRIQHTYDIFRLNDQAIRDDFALLTKGKKSQAISATNTLIGDTENIFIEEGAEVECAMLNANTGPIYIGKNAKILEGCLIRGPLAMCEHSVLKMGAKIYGATTLGPYCKVGGEVNNSVLLGYTNKGHEGFLGNSVLGEWCNLGADTNNSNLKNNYDEIRLWNYNDERFVPTGLQFCGLIMGDHSKTGINTMLNTGTVIGVSANVYGAGYPRNFIPSFAWGGPQGFTTYKLNKVYETAERVMQRRDKTLDEKEQKILQYVFDFSQKYRRWEKQSQQQAVSSS